MSHTKMEKAGAAIPHPRKKNVRKYEETMTRYFDTATGGVSVTTGGRLDQLTAVIAGSSMANRGGSMIILRKLKWYAEFTAGDITNVCRIMILRQLDPVAGLSTLPYSVPSSGDVFPSEEQWETLHDEVFSFAPRMGGSVGTATASGTATDATVLTMGTIDLGNREIRFTGSTATAAGPGHIYAYIVTDSTVTPNPGYAGTYRLFFEAT